MITQPGTEGSLFRVHTAGDSRTYVRYTLAMASGDTSDRIHAQARARAANLRHALREAVGSPDRPVGWYLAADVAELAGVVPRSIIEWTNHGYIQPPDPPSPEERQRQFEKSMQQILAMDKAELDARLHAEKERGKRPRPTT